MEEEPEAMSLGIVSMVSSIFTGFFGGNLWWCFNAVDPLISYGQHTTIAEGGRTTMALEA